MKKLYIMFLFLFSINFLTVSCNKSNSTNGNNGTSTTPGDSGVSLSVTGFNQNHVTYMTQEVGNSQDEFSMLELSASPTFTPVATPANGYIISGAPDYLKVTVSKIQVTVGSVTDTLWEGTKVLNVTGGTVDISDITSNLQKIHSGTATSIAVTFASKAQVKGSLTNTSFYTTASNGNLVTGQTVYTVADAPYNAATHTGGASSYTHFTAPSAAEEMDIYLSGDSESFTVTAACNTLISSGENTATVSIVFDLNRILRFFSGGKGGSGGGVNPPDPSDKAYFFAHSLLGSFVGIFFGKPGTIEGYQTRFATTGSTTSIPGWMTMIYDSNGNFLSGMLMGDDDNSLTISKGIVTSYTTAGDGSTTFKYNIAGGTVTGFNRVSTLNYYTPLTTFSTTPDSSQPSGAQSWTGSAFFQLKMKQ